LSTTLLLKFDLFSNSSFPSQEPRMESTNRHYEHEAQDDELPTTRRPPAQLRPAPVSKTAGSRKKTVPQRRKIGGQSELAILTTPSTVVEGEEINNTQLVVRTRSERGNQSSTVVRSVGNVHRHVTRFGPCGNTKLLKLLHTLARSHLYAPTYRLLSSYNGPPTLLPRVPDLPNLSNLYIPVRTL
jgi:hypothetical protein